MRKGDLIYDEDFCEFGVTENGRGPCVQYVGGVTEWAGMRRLRKATPEEIPAAMIRRAACCIPGKRLKLTEDVSVFKRNYRRGSMVIVRDARVGKDGIGTLVICDAPASNGGYKRIEVPVDHLEESVGLRLGNYHRLSGLEVTGTSDSEGGRLNARAEPS